MRFDVPPLAVAEHYAEIGRQLSGFSRPHETLDALSQLAVDQVPGAEYAGITVGRNGKMATVAATDEIVNRTDAIQYELRSGPCVDAIVDDAVYKPADLRSDTRWPEFGRRAAADTGILSMLSFRLYLEENTDRTIAGLNMYATTPNAFDEESQAVALLLATHGALAVAASSARQRADNLERALTTSREIGIAIGILMAQHKVTREQGFDLLRITSQGSNRRLADIATEVADTGTLPDPRTRRS
jgi:GAF domain-containing protein